MCANWHVENLNDLFYALFRAEKPQNPVIRGWQRLNREDYFNMFFPEVLCKRYLSRTKSNLTWFFNDDHKNKGIKRAVIDMLLKDGRRMLDEVHQKCRNVLWPQGQYPSFENEELRKVLGSIRIRSAVNARLRILEKRADGTPDPESRLTRYFEADPSAALARVILTLSVSSDATDEVMGIIWMDQDLSRSFLADEKDADSRMRYGQLLYLGGKRDKAYQVFESVAISLNSNAQTYEESVMYCRMAEMLLIGDGHYRDRNLALEYMKKSLLEANPASFYVYSRNLESDIARQMLEKAASLGYIPAVRELGNAWFSGNERLNCVRDIHCARQWFAKALNGHGSDSAYCAYMLGHISEIEEDIDTAVSSYKLARDKGSAEAAQRLMQLNWAEPQSADDDTMQPSALEGKMHYVLMNEPDGYNTVYGNSLKGPCRVMVCGTKAGFVTGSSTVEMVRSTDADMTEALRHMADELFAPTCDEFPHLGISLMSEDQQANLLQCVRVLKILEAAAAKLSARRWELVDAVSIYVCAEHEYASLMLDSAFESMNGMYFQVRLCDPAWDAADRLLSTAPIFLPAIRNEEIKDIRIVILGTSDTAMAVLRRAVSLPLPEQYNVSINVFGKDAAGMQTRFDMLCPGVSTAAPVIFRTVPEFHECDVENGGVNALLRRFRDRMRSPEIECPEAELFGLGNYYVVATNDDAVNTRIGANLRSELIKVDPSFTNLPFIAVHVKNAISSWLTENIHAGSGAVQQNWYSMYDLHCFSAASVYTRAGFSGDVVEHRAKAIHMHYYGDAEETAARHKILSEYFCRQYNRDSSRATALFLMYRLFAAGIKLPHWRMYGNPEAEANIASDYVNIIKEPGMLDKAARMEHIRWNCYMLSMGWEQATPVQVSTYVQRGNPSHQLHIAKLHPFICDWASFESGELLRQVSDAVHSYFPEKQVYDPIAADREAVLVTPDIIRVR